MNTEEYEVKFFALLKAMGELYNKTFSGIVYEMWFNDIKRFDYEAVKKAFSIHRQSPDNGQFMPKPGDLIRILEGTSKDNSHVAWSKVKKSISAVGSYETIVFDDPIIHRVIQDMGGWISLCATSIDELPFKGNEFKNRYTAYKSQGEVPDYPAKLYGICESENTANNLLEHIPKPIMVGDPERAKQVLLIGTNRKSLQLTTGPGNGLKQLATSTTKTME